MHASVTMETQRWLLAREGFLGKYGTSYAAICGMLGRYMDKCGSFFVCKG